MAAASRVLLLLDDGGGHGEAGHRLIALHAPGFYLCLHGAAAVTGGAPTATGGAATAHTGGAVQRGSDDARTGVLAAVPAWSNSPLLIELNWSGELLNHAPAWAATSFVGPSKVGEAPIDLARIQRAWRATQLGSMPENISSEAIRRVEKMAKEEMGERRRGAILPRYLSGHV